MAWVTAMAVPAAIGVADDWPAWRGPARSGTSTETLDLAAWPPEGPRILWRTQVGAGYAAVSVAGGRVYAVGNDGGRDTVWCLEADTGRALWRHAYACRGSGGGYGGPRVAPTVDDGAVYVLSIEGHLRRLDADSGRAVWSKNLVTELGAALPRHGWSCHPLILGQRLILEVGARGGAIVAFDKATGDVLWKAGDEAVGYSSPVAYRLHEKTYVAMLTGTALVGLDPDDGHPLWRYPWKVPYEINVATPIVRGRRIFISSGYGLGGAVVEVGRDQVRTVWRSQEMSNHFASCVLWEESLYGFDGAPLARRDTHRTLLKCLDFETGRARWAHEGLGKGSLMAADGKLVILSERGELVIAEASPDAYRELRRAKVLDNTCWTMPVLADGRLYCRNGPGDLVCVDLRPPAQDKAQGSNR